MGMFDSCYDEHGTEWQTKAFYNTLHTYKIGDTVPSRVRTCQIEALMRADRSDGTSKDGYLEVKDGVLKAFSFSRLPSVPLLDYYGEPVDKETSV